ncbi:MAG: prepilin-type N-terminal cleavage/methylation domain-containing protein [Verrucomicrobiota bacterium JB024]|jgi:prepilin-type N-terminal cleavage/methylation domain-containing protein/prepilin-type processing-associated H-X9-DG protein|nr:prepilin-type N-terminal cleavage/methylation domain-containing protein [Verrucomicrobiota bacterium JB024]
MKNTKETARPEGFSLIELMTVMAVLAILAMIIVSVVGNVRQQAMTSRSMSNIRELVTANYACASDTGRFAKAENKADTKRWHGKKVGGNWVGYGGFLTEYLGQDRSIRKCPVLEQMLTTDEGDQFDEGTGGYGYNAVYLGNDPGAESATSSGGNGWWDIPTVSETAANRPGVLIDPANTVMFTSTALVRGGGLVETYLSAPYYSLVNSNLDEALTPTTHFRFGGKALVAWCDGHVTLEEPNDAYTGWNAYGDDNNKYRVGWFGPTDNNGYWNPNYTLGRAY